MKVVLIKPHTHAGIDYAVGAEIDVNDQDAVFLMEHGVINDLSPAKPKAKTTNAEVK